MTVKLVDDLVHEREVGHAKDAIDAGMAGDLTRASIQAQPDWLRQVPSDRRLPDGARVVYTGCGTSFHAAQTGGDAVQALEAALRGKKIAGAGLDVWEKEPPPLDHPLLKYDNVMVTPHTAGVTREARVNMGRIAAEQMLAALDGKPVARVLNPQVWPRYAARFKETFGITPEAPSVAGG